MANGIKKEQWQSSFNLIGEARVNDYTFTMDKRSEKSSWIYNSMGLVVDCGEKFGSCRADLMGGYSDERQNLIYAHGKDTNGNDDFAKQIIVDWEDRFNDDILEEVGDLSFLTVGLEKTTAGKTYYKKFLSEYDAIAYIQEHLEDGMVVNVKGRLQYSMYNEVVQVRKTIQSIVLSSADPSKYRATFTQSILIDKDSASLKNVDKDKSVMYVDARVLDYVKEINGVEIKGNYPFQKQFEFPMDLTKPDLCKKIYEKLFKVKKGITQITFDGDFVEGGAQVTATIDDVPDDIKDLIELGIYTEEEALQKCSASGSRERRMILRKPTTRLVGDAKTPVLQIFENKYDDDDLVINLGSNEEEDMSTPFDEVEESSSDNSDMDWLNDL